MKKSLLLFCSLGCVLPLTADALQQPEISLRWGKLIQQDGLTFRDLNRDGKLSPYEDWRLPADVRAGDLLARMTLEEKAGMMMHGSAPAIGDAIGRGSAYDLTANRRLIRDRQVNSLITRLNKAAPAEFARQNNLLQEIAESSRLGIPLTISIDPRNTYSYSIDDTPSADGFSQWPTPPGIAALNDEAFTRHYADIIRQEYRAIGVTQALSPMADLASEPRWSRIDGTFGDNKAVVKAMVRGYVGGMQNGDRGLNSQSVSAVVKHWVGYGASDKGFDGHHNYGKYAPFKDSQALEDHIYPFTGAFEAGVAGVMPTYAILQGAVYKNAAVEQVGAGFNAFLLQNVLRGEYGFQGVIISDWLITADCAGPCLTGHPAGETPVVGGMPWGVESLSKEQRFIKAIEAGIDQFGGVDDSSIIVQAVQQGRIALQRIDQSVIRILTQKFQLGQFEAPFVDPDKAQRLFQRQAIRQQAEQAQYDALVLLKKQDGVLPLRPGTRVYVWGLNQAAARGAGLDVVENPAQAQVALIRATAPYQQPHKNFFFGALYHEGALDFPPDDAQYRAILAASRHVPTIVTVYLDRPAVLTAIEDKVSVLLGNFGVSDSVLLRSLMSERRYRARLPFELPYSMAAVESQRGDVPHDSSAPLYFSGFGLQ
ncbi:glycoside hydrolase family 3 protein [Affinibrenneria salicis]|uniref:beta-glucosidase n=1 Tax=Affinibrenneria salicis TaxID=2590031 RepID=A0A5J5FTF8_9GAMM|nr:glycoside hydrolase family 3 N-terminal domain-containing protein [Affinibrenneria salicis]KAA8996419.1 glycoside hydrolase family 3 protein [Affinibrenneria salicis]